MKHPDYFKQILSLLKLTFFSVCLLVFAACSSFRQDGPPRWSVDVSRIPDATPKAEPRSRYGNMSNYRVNGKTYYVKPSSRNYHEKGIASWYGTRFHDQRTSSGEIYNMMGMTAAHKTLPLPTYARVTNLHNHRSVVVKINDRGPFAPGRIIDLSWAAAKKLGMTGHGTASVEVTAIDPSASKATNPQTPTRIVSAPATNNDSKNSVFVRAGTFQNRAFAENLKTRITRMAMGSPVRITRFSGQKFLYRVEIGPLKNTASATLVRHRLSLAGLDQGHVVHHVGE